MSKSLSAEQNKIVDLLKENTDKVIVVEAVAGCGKTSVISSYLRCLDANKRALVLAFNVAAVAELKHRVGDKTRHSIHTFHGFASEMLDHPKIVNRKHEKRFETEKRSESWFTVKRQIDMVRSLHPFEPTDAASLLALTLVTMYGTSEVEIDDLPVCALLHRKTSKFGYSVIIVDEAQDSTPVQIALLRSIFSSANAAQLVVVGDRRQSIYGFRYVSGALDLFKTQFDALVGRERVLQASLHVCFRCPQKVVKIAALIHSGITCAEENQMGCVKVVQLSAGNVQTFLHNLSKNQQVYCITRQNEKCMQFLLHALRLGWEDFLWFSPSVASDIMVVVSLLLQGFTEDSDATAYVRLLRIFKTKNLACLLYDRWNDIRQQQAADMSDISPSVIQILNSPMSLIDTLIFLLTKVCSNLDTGHAKLVLMTAHCTKGLTLDGTVCILDYNNYKNNTDDRNLLYVAVTRATEKLIFLVTSETLFRPSNIIDLDVLYDVS